MLLSRVGDPEVFWDTVKDADWWFVLLAFVLGIGTDVAFGITFLGNVPIRLPVWPSIELQSAMSFSNLAVPVAADTAMQVRFLQKNGLDLGSAVAAGGILSSVSEIIVQVGLLFLAIWLAPDSIDFGRIDTNQIVVVVLIVVLLIGVAMAVIFGVRRIRHRVLPPIQRALGTVWAAVKTPSRLALLIVGNIVAQCLYAASLLACVEAFGASINFWTLLALNIGISVIASLVPIPGGGTAVSAVGLAGMITAFGVPAAAASAAVLDPPARGDVPPRDPGLVRHQRPGEEGDVVGERSMPARRRLLGSTTATATATTHFGRQAHLHLGVAQLADGLVEHHLAAVELDAGLRLHRVGDVGGGDRAEELAALAGAGLHLDACASRAARRAPATPRGRASPWPHGCGASTRPARPRPWWPSWRGHAAPGSCGRSRRPPRGGRPSGPACRRLLGGRSSRLGSLGLDHLGTSGSTTSTSTSTSMPSGVSSTSTAT